MEFALGTLAALLVCLLGELIFERRHLPAPINSLRVGRLHYLLLGLLVGMLFPENDLLFPLFDRMRRSLIGVGLVWLGFQAGLECVVRRQADTLKRLLSDAVQPVCAFFLTAAAVTAMSPTLDAYLGVRDNLGLVVLVLGAFAITHRTVEPIRHRRAAHAPQGSILSQQPSAFANPVALLLLGAFFPLFRGDAVVRIGPMVSASYEGSLTAAVGLALLTGIALDFAFHAHRDGLRCLCLTAGILSLAGGMCLHLQIPGIFVGFAGGVWLIHTTVRKREVLELAECAGEGAERLLFLLAGTVIGGYGGGLFFDLLPLIPAAIAFCSIRAASRMAGAAAGLFLSGANWTWPQVWATGWRPSGSLSVGLAIQMLFLPIQFSHHTLVAALIFSAFLNQMLPPFRLRRHAEAPAAPRAGQAPSKG